MRIHFLCGKSIEMEIEKKVNNFEMNTVNIYDSSMNQKNNPVIVPKKKRILKEAKTNKIKMSKTLPNQTFNEEKQQVVEIEKKISTEDENENEIIEEKDESTVNEEREMLSLIEFSNIIQEYSCTRTSRDDTIRNLDRTLLNNEPKKGRWLLESGDDIDFLDRLAIEKQNDNRARGRYVWNEAIDSIISKYAPDIDKEKEYEALKIMDESYISKQKKESTVIVEEEESNIKTESK